VNWFFPELLVLTDIGMRGRKSLETTALENTVATMTLVHTVAVVIFDIVAFVIRLVVHGKCSVPSNASCCVAPPYPLKVFCTALLVALVV
jgi:hypothetical protein